MLARFEAYQPRDEPPSGTSGGRIAKMDRIEWRVIPEAVTSAGALLTGEVDWISPPIPELLPRLRRSRDIVVGFSTASGCSRGCAQITFLDRPRTSVFAAPLRGRGHTSSTVVKTSRGQT